MQKRIGGCPVIKEKENDVKIIKSKKDQLKEARKLWQSLGNIPVNGDGEIDEQWNKFPPGTDREEIWLWFEEFFPNISVAEDLMYSK